MVKLNVYQADKLVGSGEDKVHVALNSGEYAAGAFKGEFVDPDGFVNPQFDFPAFRVGPEPIPLQGFSMKIPSIQSDGTVPLKNGESFQASVADIMPENADISAIVLSGFDPTKLSVVNDQKGNYTITALVDGPETETLKWEVPDSSVTNSTVTVNIGATTATA